MGLSHDGRNMPDGTVEGYYTVSDALLQLLLLLLSDCDNSQ
jgi:hypothetical protein